LCRTLTGHAWEIVNETLGLSGGALKITLHCSRCKARRIDRFSYATGGLSGRGYRYANGYRLTESDKQKVPSRNALRREVLHALKENTRETHHAAVRPVRGCAAASH